MGVVTWVRDDLQEVITDDTMRRALAKETGSAASRFKQVDDDTVIAYGRYTNKEVAVYQRFVDGIPQPERRIRHRCPYDGHELSLEQGGDRLWRYCPHCGDRRAIGQHR